MRKTNFDKSYEKYLSYFETDRAKGIPTHEPLSRRSYELMYKRLKDNEMVTANELKNMPRYLYRETGRITRPGTVNAVRTLFRQTREDIRGKEKRGETLTDKERELLGASSSQNNLLKKGNEYMAYFIEMYGREEAERIVSP